MNNPVPILKITDLVKHFPIKTGLFNRVSGNVFAVDGVSLELNREIGFSVYHLVVASSAALLLALVRVFAHFSTGTRYIFISLWLSITSTVAAVVRGETE